MRRAQLLLLCALGATLVGCDSLTGSPVFGFGRTTEFHVRNSTDERLLVSFKSSFSAPSRPPQRVGLLDRRASASVVVSGRWNPYEDAVLGRLQVEQPSGDKLAYHQVQLLTFRDSGCEYALVEVGGDTSFGPCVTPGGTPWRVTAYLRWLDHEGAVIRFGSPLLVVASLMVAWLLVRWADSRISPSEDAQLWSATLLVWAFVLPFGLSPIGSSPTAIRGLIFWVSMVGTATIFFLPHPWFRRYAIVVLAAGLVEIAYALVAAASVALVIGWVPESLVARLTAGATFWACLAAPGVVMAYAALTGARDPVPARPGWGGRDPA